MSSDSNDNREVLEVLEAEFEKLSPEEKRAINELVERVEGAVARMGATFDNVNEEADRSFQRMHLLEAACLLAHRMYPDSGAAAKWLLSPCAELGGERPLDVMRQNEHGSARAIEVLRAKDPRAPDHHGSQRETPFAYRVEDWRMRHVAVTRSLAAAAEAARETGLGPSQVDIYAVHDGNREERVPIDRYSRKTIPTREEAIEFIRHREEKVKEAPASSRNFVRFLGIARCRRDDPIEKQIADYLESAPHQWLPTLVIAVAECLGDDGEEGT